MNAAASPLCARKRMTWCTPWSRATSDVPSVEPSSTTSNSTVSIPGIARGRSAMVSGSVAASFRQGI